MADMGYDGEDYSPEHYARQAAERNAEERGNMEELVLQLAPKNWKYIARLLPLGYAKYGEFSEDDALSALGRVASKHHLLRAWNKAGLIWPRQRAIFRKDLTDCITLSPSGEQLAELYGGKRYP